MLILFITFYILKFKFLQFNLVLTELYSGINFNGFIVSRKNFLFAGEIIET